MQYLFKNLKYLILGVLLLMILFFYFGVFSPLKKNLENTLEDNFQDHVIIAEINVENFINRCLEGTDSLSSRTMIKNKLAEHINDEITFTELKNYTQPKYVDGAKVLDKILYAFRIADEKIVAHYGQEHIPEEFKIFQDSGIRFKIIAEEEIIWVKSPIIDGDKILGYDLAAYDLSQIMTGIESDNVQYQISMLEEPLSEIIERKNEIEVGRQLLDSNYWLTAVMFKSDLYQKVNNLSFKIIAGTIMILVFIIFSFNLVIKKTSQKVINRLENQLEEITEISETDCLIDAYNRSKFIKELENEINRIKRYNSSLSVIMMDIDGFKEVNDTYGHDIGDQVLIKISEIIHSEIRDIDIFARYGGDEFMLILPETDGEEARIVAERLRQKIAGEEFEKINKLTCSFGVTEYRESDDLDILLKRVDGALYKAKENGRNSVVRC